MPSCFVYCVFYFVCFARFQGAAGAVLTKLRESQFGWVFNDPVDPVHLNLPDYFEVKYSRAFAELTLACLGLPGVPFPAFACPVLAH